MKSYIKRLLLILSSFAVVILFGVFNPGNLNSKIITNVPSDISEDELKAVVIEDFEESGTGDKGWDIKSDPIKYEKKETAEKKKRKNPVPVLNIKMLQGQPNDLNVEKWSLTGLGKKKEKCLGIHFKFRYPGFNSVHILAPPEIGWGDKKPVKTYNSSTRTDVQERGIQLPGKARAVSLWVHGRGHPYDFELWLKDYRGNSHILKFGSINFVGWRPIKVNVPLYIPQEYDSYPQTRVTKITRFVLRAQQSANAEELTADVFFFFDQLKVLTDTYEVNFDGQDLHKAFEGGTTSPKKEGGK